MVALNTNDGAGPDATTIGVLRETHAGEQRVSLVPADVKRLAGRVTIIVEHGAGEAAGFADTDYAAAGARLASTDAVIAAAQIVAKVRAPGRSDALRAHTILISLGGRDATLGDALRAHSITHFGLERLPRTTRAQSMDVLSSQAAIAGYAAVLEGARHMSAILPMMTTAAGSIRPANMIAVGAGVAGLQAIATARRLGAVAHGFDVREAAREQIESLGAKFVSIDTDNASAEGAGGYAGEQSEHEQQRVRAALARHLVPMQLIVTSAQIPGRRAPLLIDEAAIAALSPGSVIVDLAAESGGNTALTRADDVVTIGGVHILGPTNLPSAAAADASRLFSGNIRALLDHLVTSDGKLTLDTDDAITAALLAGQPKPDVAIAA